jgi:putative alpha-1,2-mannosidase
MSLTRDLPLNLGPFNIYVQKATINRMPIDLKNNPFLNSKQISGPTTLEFWMSDKP